MVFNATFNNISVISWRRYLLDEYFSLKKKEWTWLQQIWTIATTDNWFSFHTIIFLVNKGKFWFPGNNNVHLVFTSSHLVFTSSHLVFTSSHSFCRGFMLYLCYLYLFMNNAVRHNFHIKWCLCCLTVTQWVPLVEQELLILLEHPSSCHVFSGVYVAQYLVNHFLSSCPFSFGYYSFCPSIYDFGIVNFFLDKN